MTLRPVEVVGGGLAGLALGLGLRRAGVSVTIFEAGDYPRHRVCGEFITGLGAGTISRLGLESALHGALHHREVAWFHRSRPVRVQQLPSPALGISRHRLDARLAEEFRGAGGSLVTHRRVVTDIAPEGRVFTTGRRRGAPSWIGLKLHVTGLDLSRDLELHLGDEAYVGLSRVEEDQVNVCGLFRRRALCAKGENLLLAYLQAAGLGGLARRVAAASVDPSSFCAVAALGFDRRVPPADRFCLGEAAAMIPPFTGNGMAMAFQGAELALDPLLAYARGEAEWAGTIRAVNLGLHRRFRLRLVSAAALHPFLLEPGRQRWLSRLTRARLLPFRPLYAVLH